MNHRSKIVLPSLMLFSALSWAQPPDLNKLPAYKPEYQVSGALRIYGSELKGQMVAWEQGFLKYHPDVVFSNSFHTSSEGAMAGLYAAGADLAPAGDDAKITDQMPFFNTYRYLPTEISVATGGYEKRGTLWAFDIVVNKDNPITQLSLKQLDGIFGSERTGGWEGIEYTSKYARGPDQDIRTWGQLGLTADWANKPIHTYGYAAPGFVIAWERKIFHWSDKWNPNYREFVESKEATPNDAGRAVASERMLEELSNDKYGIAWAALMHTKDYPRVKSLAIAAKDGGPYVPLTPETVQDRTYPLIRDAYIYLNRAPGRPIDPKVKEFMRYILSREGQEDIIRTGMYNALTPDVDKEEATKLE